jgi:hypothetical protein
VSASFAGPAHVAGSQSRSGTLTNVGTTARLVHSLGSRVHEVGQPLRQIGANNFESDYLIDALADATGFSLRLRLKTVGDEQGAERERRRRISSGAHKA